MPLYFGNQTVTKQLFTQQLVDSPPPVIAIDTETISVKERWPLTFSIAVSPDEAWTFDCYPDVEREVELILPLLRNPAIKKVYHNASFDMRAMPLIAEIDRSNIADTLVMARILGYSPANLEFLGPIIGKIIEPAGDTLARFSAKTMLDVPAVDRARKCSNDAKATLGLYYKFLPDTLQKVSQEYLDVESRVIPVLIDMGLKGLRIDQVERAKLESKARADVEFYRKLCTECEQGEFNPASNQQVGYILAKRGNWLPFTKSKKSLKTDEETLEFLDDPMAAVVLNFRKMSKALNTYIEPLGKEDRLFTEYYLDTDVGRTSSRNRNIQNIPDGQKPPYLNMRTMIMPDSGTFTSGDYSQEHLYILAYNSGDEAMRRVYENGEYGGDIHQYAAEQMGIPRKIAKTVNYAVVYGADAHTISVQSKNRNIKQCSKFLDSWFETFKGAAQWIKEAQTYGLRHNWSLPTLFGRSIKLPDETNWRGDIDLEAKKRKAVNFPILGSDGEVIKRALLICREKNLPLALQVHDSITCDGDITFPVDELEHIAPVRIPFVVSKSERWQ